jgi:hypothetical protein
MKDFFARITRLTSVALVFTISSAATAQSAAHDSRWVPWIGCWLPSASQATPGVASLLCIAPAGANSVELATIDSGRVLARDTIDASGTQRPTAADGCAGWRSAQWSADGRRVYVRSELNCSGGIKRVATGMLAFSSDDGWVDVHNVRAGKTNGTRSTRYLAAAPGYADVPTEFTAIMQAGGVTSVSRVLAGAAVELDDITEASKHVDAAVVETWIIERGQAFSIDGKTLANLASAGVPGSVTDVMIGVSYPERFVVGREPSPAGRSVVSQTSTYPSGYVYSYGYDYRYPYDPYGYGGYYGYGNYGYGNYNRYYSTYYDSPVIISGRSREKEEVPHGKMVNGQGYTRTRPDNSTAGESSSGSRAGSSDTRSSGGSSKSGGSSGGSSSSGSSSGSGSGSSSGRTAHKKGG